MEVVIAGFDNDIGFSSNFDFSSTSGTGGSIANGLQTNGQMWIGATAANAGGTHINVGNITSPLGTLSIGYSSPNITLDLAGGAKAIEHLTGNTGGALNPDGSNNFNILGTNSALTGFSPWITGSASTLTVNMPGTAKWVVNPTANLGTHQTIQAAITAASSGDTIFITQGTYTEDLTISKNIVLVGYNNDQRNSVNNTIIIGKITVSSTSLNINLYGLTLQTNSDYCVNNSQNGSQLTLTDCYINASNNTALNLAGNSNTAINLYNCSGAIASTQLLFTTNSVGALIFQYCNFQDVTSPGICTVAGGTNLYIYYSTILFPISITASPADIRYSTFGSVFSPNVNTTWITTVTSNSTNLIDCIFYSGTASAISIGVGTTVNVSHITVSSSNANAITGLGTIVYGVIDFTGSSSTINTSTQTNTVTEIGSLTLHTALTVANGGTGQTTLTNHSVLVGAATSAITQLSAMTDGQILIGKTSNDPQIITPTAGTGLTVTANSTTLSYALTNPSGFAWTDATGATQTLAVNNGYITDHSATVVYTLPATAALGDTIKIVGKLGLATITPNANQQILIGSTSGAVGVTGTAVSNNVGDCIELVCITAGASSVYRANSVVGTWTLTT